MPEDLDELFDGLADADALLDPDSQAAHDGDRVVDHSAGQTARAHRAELRRAALRLHFRDNLAKLIDHMPAPGECLHVLSDAGFHFWTWAILMLDWLDGRSDSLLVSTWALNRDTTTELLRLIDAGAVPGDRVGFLTDPALRRRRPEVFTALVAGLRARGGRFRAYMNHSKILCLGSEARGDWLTITSSANMTRNPRTENYTVTNDRGVYDFFEAWFDDMLRAIPPDLELVDFSILTQQAKTAAPRITDRKR